MTKRTTRRTFLRESFLVAAGAAGGTVLPAILHSFGPYPVKGAVTNAKTTSSGAEKRLIELGIKLPPTPKPVAVYVPAVVFGNTLYTSGHGPRQANGKMVQGKVGGELTLEQGKAAARVVGLNVLSTVRSTIGSLDKVVRLVKVLGMVNCTTDFTQQPQVINGFSELMVDVFGPQNGKAARSAVGMGSLPSNIPVEIEAIFEVRV
jgi:enamine deaminase RidA (YjgF/YER057c/UK114 family)